MDEGQKFQNLCEELSRHNSSIQIMNHAEAQSIYGTNTISYSVHILGAIKPSNHADVVKIVTLAHEIKIKLYTISTGHNWGYGSATPIVDNSVIIDLSQMNSIIDFNPENGLITVEPGVTTYQAWLYLQEHAYPYLIPTTGAGFTGSLLANALERGFGIVPTSDHFSAVMHIKAVLADGSTYESHHDSLAPNTQLGKLYKWGIGAYCDGLFTQSNLGIVTEITIALRRQPENICVCCIGATEHNLDGLIQLIHLLTQKYPAHFGNIQLMNRNRLSAHNKKSGRIRVQDWNLFLVLYGNRAVTKLIQKEIIKQAHDHALTSIFINEEQIKRLLGLKNTLMIKLIEKVAKISLNDLRELFSFFRGKPTNKMIGELLYPEEDVLDPNKPLDLDKDKKGIFWVAPLIPLSKAHINDFSKMIEPILNHYNFSYSVTMTAFGNYCFDATIPLVYDPTDKDQTNNARLCYKAALQACMEKEYIPYRIGIQSMKDIMGEQTPHYRLVDKIKSALDPNGILSPGRYHGQ